MRETENNVLLSTRLLMQVIGKKVLYYRNKEGMTQFDLSCLIDTDVSMISKLERGVYNNISIKTLGKLSNALNCSIKDLLNKE